MKILLKNIQDVDCVCDTLILPFFEDDDSPYNGMKLSVTGLIGKIRKKEFRAVLNELILLPAPDDIRAGRILLVGLGSKKEVTTEKLRQAGGKACSYLRDMNMKSVALSTRVFGRPELSAADFVEGALLGLYTFNKYRKESRPKKLISLTVPGKIPSDTAERIRKAVIVSSAVAYAKDLVNAPANDMTPADLADAACTLKRKNVSVRVLEKKNILKIGMGAFLAVSYGSRELPKFIVAEYKGSRKAPVVLIGKSVTFDSGGLSIKPADGMEKMKYDMAGGAAVLGVLKAASELRLPVHLICLLPATENLSGGAATRPGDVVRSVSGKSIEIANTDAEGRLTLADAIEYAKRFKPAAIIDIATLTGACALAFGGEIAAMMGNDPELLESLRKAGDETYERVCALPLYDEYKDYLKSDIADIRNIGTRTGSLMSSAYFLSEFAGKAPWAHIDIAGTAWVEKDRPYIPRGASGIGVRLLLNLIERVQ